VEDHGNAQLGTAPVNQVERALGGREAAVHRVQLDRHRAQGQLALQLLGDRVVEVGVEVGDQAEPPRVVLQQRQQVLDRLDAGHLRAVLAHQQGHVDALGLQEGVEAVGADRSLPVVQLAQRVGIGKRRPCGPGQLQRRQPGHVQVHVDQGQAVDHRPVPAGASRSL
jgi:hypothetical protein